MYGTTLLRVVKLVAFTGLIGLCVNGQALGDTADYVDAAEPAITETDNETLVINPYATMDLEQLMQTQVTSVAGVAQDWFYTPAAMYVINRDDVRRSGLQLLPEILRLAPGVTVGRFDSRQWSVSIRGFESMFSNKLLVRIDGRTIYDPTFAGTFWDIQSVLVEDLDRIEIVRGPGATLWGANAVNGVINVTTRSAKDTQGGYVTGIIGTELEPLVAARYGGQIGESTWYRVWGQYLQHAPYKVLGTDFDRPDDWELFSGGFRIDHEWDDHITATVSIGGHYSDRIGEGIAVPVPGAGVGTMDTEVDIRDGEVSGYHILGRVERANASDDQGWSLQAYYDRTNRVVFSGLGMYRDTYDLDWRHNMRWGSEKEHDTVWGLGYRYTRDFMNDGRFIEFRPQSHGSSLFSGFVQHTWNLTDTIHLMAGTKLEHNDYTGVEWQPSGRIWWTPNKEHTLWAAASRPVRTPSRTEDDIALTLARINGGGGSVIPIDAMGDIGIESERLLSLEAGYRVKPLENLTVDLAAYHNQYEDIVGFVAPGAPPGNPYMNLEGATSFGMELAVNWKPLDNVKLEAVYSYIKMDLDRNDTTIDDYTPENQVRISSTYDITPEIQLNGVLYAWENPDYPVLDSYVRLDAGVTWHPTNNLEVSFWGQNLLDDQHMEQTNLIFTSTRVEVPRSFYVQLTWRF